MRVLRGLLFTTVLTAGCTYLGFRVMLNDGAKKEVRNAASSIRDSYRRITEVVSDITGITIEEDDAMPQSAKDARRQWQELGY